jgi:hypothetical protein
MHTSTRHEPPIGTWVDEDAMFCLVTLRIETFIPTVQRPLISIAWVATRVPSQ